jgi:hypothetical protein
VRGSSGVARAFRWLVAGTVVEAVALGHQILWHRENPGAEPFDNVLLVHAGIYLGAVVALVAALALARASRFRASFALVALGAGVRVVALAFDAVAHAAREEPGTWHGLYGAGIWIAGAGAVALALRFATERGAARRAAALALGRKK